MTLVLALLPVLGALIPFILNEISKHQELKQEPKTIITKTDEQINNIIANHDNNGSALLVNNLLQRLHDRDSGIK